MPDADRHLHLRGARADHTLTFSRDRRGNTSVLLSPDSPLVYGYDDAGTSLDEQSMHRLRHWLITGQALPRTDPRLAAGEEGPGRDRVRAVLDAHGITADVLDGDAARFSALVDDLLAALDVHELRPQTPDDGPDDCGKRPWINTAQCRRLPEVDGDDWCVAHGMPYPHDV